MWWLRWNGRLCPSFSSSSLFLFLSFLFAHSLLLRFSSVFFQRFSIDCAFESPPCQWFHGSSVGCYQVDLHCDSVVASLAHGHQCEAQRSNDATLRRGDQERGTHGIPQRMQMRVGSGQARASTERPTSEPLPSQKPCFCLADSNLMQ